MSDAFSSFIRTLKRPHFAVIFVTPQTAGFPHFGYMTENMAEFAAKQPGFLGIKTLGPVNGFSTTMSFWSSEEAIKAWETRMDNKPAGYEIRVVKTEDDYVKKPVV
jgi:heme-degrading monooxygenase HmoA